MAGWRPKWLEQSGGNHHTSVRHRVWVGRTPMAQRRMSTRGPSDLFLALWPAAPPCDRGAAAHPPGTSALLLFLVVSSIQSEQVHLQQAIAQGTCTITTANFQGHALFQRYFPRKGRRDSRKVDPTFPASALSVLQSERPKP